MHNRGCWVKLAIIAHTKGEFIFNSVMTVSISFSQSIFKFSWIFLSFYSCYTIDPCWGLSVKVIIKLFHSFLGFANFPGFSRCFLSLQSILKVILYYTIQFYASDVRQCSECLREDIHINRCRSKGLLETYSIYWLKVCNSGLLVTNAQSSIWSDKIILSEPFRFR